MYSIVLVLDEDGDVWIFRTAERAAEHLEAIDVLDGSIRLFDCGGAQFEVLAENYDAPVRIGRRIEGGDDFDLVRAAAINLLRRLPQKRRASTDPAELATPDEICRALGPYAR